MAHSDRNKSRRSLGFESLEARKSLTTVAAAVDPGFESNVAEVSSATSESANRLLLYVSTLDEVSIERSLPDPADSQAVDQLIAETNPGSFSSVDR